MDLYTGCPHCRTTFRVTTQQLQSSGGQVRCGSCNQVFDAFATLNAQEPASGPAPAPAVLPQAPGPAPAAFAAAPDSRPAPVAVPARADPAAGLYEWEFRMPAPRPRRALWGGLSLLLLLLLAGQAAYAYRMELSIALPQLREWQTQFCASIGCSVRPLQAATYLHIEASDLKAVDPALPGEIELSVLVRNRAPVELAYPAFELTLTDSQDRAVARRVFLPAEYLAPGAAPALKSGAELPLHLYLDTGELRAAGYRVYLFYP
jgi:predicted Zn finger-like uncharacterized protein